MLLYYCYAYYGQNDHDIYFYLLIFSQLLIIKKNFGRYHSSSFLGLRDELFRIWWSKVTVTAQNMFLAITQEFIH